MLYKAIYYSFFSVYGINKITNAELYTASATDVGWNHWSCAGAGADDTCSFHCNIENWGYSIHCESAGVCNVYPEEKKCFKDSTINATTASVLNVFPGALVQQPYSGATFHLPSSGDAVFHNNATADGPYQQIIIQAGAQTNSITLYNEAKDDWKKAEINAQTAKFLRILSQGADFNGQDILTGPTIINCPQHSTFVSNYYEAPCFINIASGGSLDSVQINTLYGYPHDVFIKRDADNDLKDTYLTCSEFDNKAVDIDADIFDESKGDCFNTKTPTISPTKSPTRAPSKMPTQFPSRSPTKSPSKNPTRNPTVSPTKSPSDNPTKIPTSNSFAPSQPPTKNPTQSPTTTVAPTASPTASPSMSPTENIATTGVENEDDSGFGGSINNTLSIVLYALIALVMCTVCAFCLWYMKHKRDKNIERALSLSKASRESQVRKQKMAFELGAYVDADNKDKTGDNTTTAKTQAKFMESYAAPADDTMNQAAMHFEEGDGNEVVIKMSPKNAKMRAFSDGVVAAEYNDFVQVESPNLIKNEEAALERADTDNIEDDMDVIDDLHVTAAGDAPRDDEDLVESYSNGNSDDEVVVTQGY